MDSNSVSCVVEARGLVREFATRGGPLVILRDLDLCVRQGESVCIMGPSGVGKSTLLHILGTLDEPTRGEVSILGRNPFEMTDGDLADFRNTDLGFVFQSHHLLPQCSALENVLVPTLVAPGTGQEKAERARRLLSEVGLSDRADYLPADLSGGERQRVAIARSLVNRPRILLCDEPTGNLDEKTASDVADCFVALQKREQVSLILVTHAPWFARRFDRVLHLKGGTLIPDGKSSAGLFPPGQTP
ncbi:ABC transporter ATP-binding protein [Candidatus Sumerlaeota bacterium]|nr:ABC transporter ATP-binding protein [Candidatus Sumerlaeota bacterium]